MERPLLIKKNKYWLSEIGMLYFKYQVDYQCYDYQDSQQIDEGIDLLVLNKQDMPYYVLCLGNDYPYDFLYFPLVEEGKESRLMTSVADFVFFYDIKQNTVSIIDLPLLQEKINTQYSNGVWKDYKLVEKGLQQGIQVSKEDDVIKEAVNVYDLNSDIAEKARKIYNFRVSRLRVTETKVLPISRVGDYESSYS